MLILTFDVLLLDVDPDHLVGDVPATGDEVASGPHTPYPEVPPQVPKIPHEMMGCPALDELHHAARRDVRWNAEQKMDMVWPNVAGQDLDVARTADLADQ